MLMGDLLDTEIHPGQGESAGVFLFQRQGMDPESSITSWRATYPLILTFRVTGPFILDGGVKDLEEQKRYFVVMRDEVVKMVHAGKSLEQIEKEFKVPQEFAHYKRPERLKDFFKLFYNQLMETRLLTNDWTTLVPGGTE